MHTELKLHLFKKLINFCMKILDNVLPESEPYYPQTKMLDRVFKHFFNVYVLEVWCGRFDDVSHQCISNLKDRNFQHFLSVSRKALLFIAENDRYYRAWIGLAFIAVKEEYAHALKELSRDEFQRSHLEQWELEFKSVSERYFEAYKTEFLDMLLSANLSNLLRMRIAFEQFSAKQGKNKIGG
jgi:hypothetical protein